MASNPRPNGQLKSRWTFFRQWLKDPMSVSSISPSSPHLAKRMLAQLPTDARRVVELGAGTGVFTHALLEHGIRPDDLMVVELNPALVELLRQNFPEARVVHGDAREVSRLAGESGYLDAGPADAVFSGLGMLSMSQQAQREVLEAAFKLTREGGSFIQFTYGHNNPVSPVVLADLGLHVRRGELAWRNLPPATVFVFHRGRSTHVRPRSLAL
jgi:phosphatidylethanolamine/phosphatidyl-N-methylethanolamine N-methyltransferase